MTNIGSITWKEEWKKGQQGSLRTGYQYERWRAEVEVSYFRDRLRNVKLGTPLGSITLNNLSGKSRGFVSMINGSYAIFIFEKSTISLGLGIGCANIKTSATITATGPGGTDTLSEENTSVYLAGQGFLDYTHQLTESLNFVTRYRFMGIAGKNIAPSSFSNIVQPYRQHTVYIQGIEAGLRYWF